MNTFCLLSATHHKSSEVKEVFGVFAVLFCATETSLPGRISFSAPCVPSLPGIIRDTKLTKYRMVLGQVTFGHYKVPMKELTSGFSSGR